MHVISLSTVQVRARAWLTFSGRTPVVCDEGTEAEVEVGGDVLSAREPTLVLVVGTLYPSPSDFEAFALCGAA